MLVGQLEELKDWWGLGWGSGSGAELLGIWVSESKDPAGGLEG